MATTESPPPLVTIDEDEDMGGAHNVSDTTMPPVEMNRGVTASFPDPSVPEPLEPGEVAEIPFIQSAQAPSACIILATPGQSKPTPS